MSTRSIVFVDETMFTTNQVRAKIWFPPHDGTIFVPKKQLGFQSIAVVAATNVQGQLVSLLLRP